MKIKTVANAVAAAVASVAVATALTGCCMFGSNTGCPKKCGEACRCHDNAGGETGCEDAKTRGANVSMTFGIGSGGIRAGGDANVGGHGVSADANAGVGTSGIEAGAGAGIR